jgi:hypothetical protein
MNENWLYIIYNFRIQKLEKRTRSLINKNDRWQVMQIDPWYYAFHLGNFLADLGIAVFAIKVGHLDEVRKHLESRLRLLFRLRFITSMGMKDDLKDEIIFNDIAEKFSQEEIGNIFKSAFKKGRPKYDDLWNDLQKNLDTISDLISITNNNLMKNKNNFILKHINHIILIFFVTGILIQAIALVLWSNK